MQGIYLRVYMLGMYLRVYNLVYSRFTVGWERGFLPYHPFHCWVRKRLPVLSPVSLLGVEREPPVHHPFHCWLRKGTSLCNITLCGGIVGYSTPVSLLGLSRSSPVSLLVIVPHCQHPFHCWWDTPALGRLYPHNVAEVRFLAPTKVTNINIPVYEHPPSGQVLGIPRINPFPARNLTIRA